MIKDNLLADKLNKRLHQDVKNGEITTSTTSPSDTSHDIIASIAHTDNKTSFTDKIKPGLKFMTFASFKLLNALIIGMSMMFLLNTSWPAWVSLIVGYSIDYVIDKIS